MQWYINLIFHALSAYTSALLIRCLVSFLSLRPVNQRRRQLRSVAGLLAKKSGWLWQWWWNQKLHTIAQSLCFWPSNFHCWINCFWFDKHFIHSCDCLVPLEYLNLHWNLRFSAIQTMRNYKMFCPSGLIIVGFQVKL